MFRIGKYPFHMVGNVLEEDVYSPNGLLLLRKGTYLTERHIIMLSTHLSNTGGENILQQKELQRLAKLQDEAKREVALSVYTEGINQFYELTARDQGERAAVSEMKKIYTPLFQQLFKSDLIQSLLRVMRDSKDSTYTHSINVAVTAAIIGKVLGKPNHELFELAEMGIHHDLGKLSIPIEIIQKADPLTPKEWEVLKSHPVLGARILQQMNELRRSIVEGTLYHHERLDGSGYPQGLRGEQIAEKVQILSVADVYDAITSDRHYKKGKSPIKAALEIIHETHQGKFNPAITYPFAQFIFTQHLNEEVLLSNGEMVQLEFIQQQAPHRPLVKRADGSLLNLMEDMDVYIIDIAPPNH